MGFNEKVHAFIAAKFYVYLTQAFGDRGERAFIHATQHYAEQRGRRMAQRAIRDGRELDYGTYLEYGEWINTPEIISEGCANKSTIESWAPDYRIHITMCPWYTQLKEMGLPDAGHVYCAHLDNSICRGFNPYLTYLVPETLHKNGFCTHLIKDVNFEPGEKHPKKPEYLKGFDYHCGHSYWTYSEVAAAIFGTEGEEISAKVMQDFTDTYGQDMADTLASYRDTNFNICD